MSSNEPASNAPPTTLPRAAVQNATVVTTYIQAMSVLGDMMVSAGTRVAVHKNRATATAISTPNSTHDRTSSGPPGPTRATINTMFPISRQPVTTPMTPPRPSVNEPTIRAMTGLSLIHISEP